MGVPCGRRSSSDFPWSKSAVEVSMPRLNRFNSGASKNRSRPTAWPRDQGPCGKAGLPPIASIERVALPWLVGVRRAEPPWRGLGRPGSGVEISEEPSLRQGYFGLPPCQTGEPKFPVCPSLGSSALPRQAAPADFARGTYHPGRPKARHLATMPGVANPAAQNRAPARARTAAASARATTLVTNRQPPHVGDARRGQLARRTGESPREGPWQQTAS